MPLLTNTGGLVYHARALRATEGRWKPFREAVEAWLSDWNPPNRRLLLIGPSGGYSLPPSWLAHFEGIVAIDFDPLARRLFERRHRGCRIERWIEEDLFPVGPEGIDLALIQHRLTEYPDHAVLFSNVLGQLAVGAPDADAVERDLEGLRRLVEGRSWASYHDRLSSPHRPTLPQDGRHRDDARLAKDAYRDGEIATYSTGRFGEDLDCTLFAWECQKGFWNLIEGCRGETLSSGALKVDRTR